MTRNIFDKNFLRGVSVAAIILLPFLLRKNSLKYGLIAYLLNAITNGWLDQYLVNHKKLEYPIRFMPKLFQKNVAFDYLLYPTASVFLNNVTEKDGGAMTFIKVIGLILGIFTVEVWAAQKTKLIKWKNGWNWYHTIISLAIKSLLNIWAVRIIKKFSF
ncbi:CBO0543 family protein [Niallia sp. NCCP-28]|uniref:CBO0543 family protein n=1 Tax=Niallia sp. NCCP-28 TaxID=2934712 RepID=UPI002084FFD0|nr:CBO0543 family protein [Niallia sp. NCCP-28]GKU85089.1 hypothetical protein NCCP28_44850 [Niallia sp. NCCP-28]